MIGAAVLSFTVFGKPAGAARARATVRGKHAAVYKAPAHVDAEARVIVEARRAWVGREPLDRAVEVVVWAWFAPAPSTIRKRDANRPALPYVGKPDSDNVAKLVKDAMTRAGVWTDDSRVADLVVRRRWLPIGPDCRPVGLERVDVRVLEVA